MYYLTNARRFSVVYILRISSNVLDTPRCPSRGLS